MAHHPTPEERVEAALKEWRKDAGDLRVHFATAIREAEAAGEARGRAMEREELLAEAKRLREKHCSPIGTKYEEGAWDHGQRIEASIRARTDKENSDD